MFEPDWIITLWTAVVLMAILAVPVLCGVWLFRRVSETRADVRAIRTMLEEEREHNPW